MGLFRYPYISKLDNSTEEYHIFEDSTPTRSFLLETWERGFNQIAQKKSLEVEGSSF
jgi:hypothetical protein